MDSLEKAADELHGKTIPASTLTPFHKFAFSLSAFFVPQSLDP
jgi:hypothetical protein